MTPEEIKTVATIIDMLRAKGVKEFEGAGLRLVLNALEAPVPESSAPATDPEMCRCGHAEYQHGPGGLCVSGCEAEKCLDPKLIEQDKKAEA
jgi:hypothetical protein